MELQFTDSAMAVRACAEALEDRFVHVHGLGWLAYDGARWVEVAGKVVLEAIRAWVAGHLAAAGAAVGAAYADGNCTAKELKDAIAIAAGWRRWQALARIDATEKLARGIATLDPTELDAKPDVLNVANGTVHLPTGELIPHDPRHYLTRVAGAGYDPLALHEDWNAALRAIPPEIAPWLQVRYGQGITGHMTPDDRVVIQQGGGANGKSTVLAGVAAALGDYYFLASDKIMMASQNGAHTTDLADLRGTRFVAVEETPEAGRLDVVRLKKLAGTERITARKMRQDNVSFPATHTLFVNTNYPPVVGETDDGTWRRLLLVNFPYTFTRDPQGENERAGDPGLRDRLRLGKAGQREAVLAWLVEGAVAWYGAERVMPAVPADVERETGEWRGRTDHVAAFWADHLDPDPEAFVYGGDLIWMFNNYLRQHGNSPVAESTFVRRFHNHPVTVGAMVGRARVRQGSTTLRHSRPFGALDPFSRLPGVPAGQISVWTGMAFRKAVQDSDPGAWDQSRRENES